MSDISGRVSTLENQMSLVTQDLLLRPDQNTYSALLTTWNQQFDVLNDTVTQINVLLRNLQTLYTNLNRTIAVNQATFTGFTGTYGGYVNNIRVFTGDMYSLFTGHTGLPVTGTAPFAHGGA